jgi:hypothetical protein
VDLFFCCESGKRANGTPALVRGTESGGPAEQGGGFKPQQPVSTQHQNNQQQQGLYAYLSDGIDFMESLVIVNFFVFTVASWNVLMQLLLGLWIFQKILTCDFAFVGSFPATSRHGNCRCTSAFAVSCCSATLRI